MKLSDVVRKLELDDSKKFISHEMPSITAECIDGDIRFEFEQTSGTYTCGAVTSIAVNREWEEVKQPVSFMDAVASGKRVKVEFSNIKMKKLEGYKNYARLNDFLNLLTRDFSSTSIAVILQSCKFYIED